MSKDIDFDKPLSKEDRAWLHERSLDWRIQENDRQFGKEQPYEPPSLAAPQSYEPGTQPEPTFVQRPFDPQITGNFAGAAPVASGEDEGEEGEEIEYLTVEELKDELRARDLSTSGNKDALVDRLTAALEKE